MGSKNRMSKHLLPVMLKERGEMPWVEPFVGGGNMIDKIVGGVRLGNDSHEYVITLLRAVRDGWIPPNTVSEEKYLMIKSDPDTYPPHLVGFVGFLCSFGGKWWGGYARNSQGRNYASAGVRSLLKQAPNLQGIGFRHGNYLDMRIPKNSLIYCDPPYEGTTPYSTKFDHVEFWKWCREKSKEGHLVFVSEYNAPDDFECLKVVETRTVLNKNQKAARIEKLFRKRT